MEIIRGPRFIYRELCPAYIRLYYYTTSTLYTAAITYKMLYHAVAVRLESLEPLNLLWGSLQRRLEINLMYVTRLYIPRARLSVIVAARYRV